MTNNNDYMTNNNDYITNNNDYITNINDYNNIRSIFKYYTIFIINTILF